MKRLIGIILFVAAWTGAGYSQLASKQQQVFVIHGPTIVAFFPPVTTSDLDNDQDTNEALNDFQFYTGQARTPLNEAGIDFREADARSFRIRMGKKVWTYRTGKIGVGYYFIAPGKKPQVEYGVMSGEDILNAARKYFGIAIRRAQ